MTLMSRCSVLEDFLCVVAVKSSLFTSMAAISHVHICLHQPLPVLVTSYWFLPFGPSNCWIVKVDQSCLSCPPSHVGGHFLFTTSFDSLLQYPLSPIRISLANELVKVVSIITAGLPNHEHRTEN